MTIKLDVGETTMKGSWKFALFKKIETKTENTEGILYAKKIRFTN